MDSAIGGYDEGYSTDIDVEGSACNMEVSPGMTKYWRPNCAKSLKPHVRQNFVSLDSAFRFYKQYAGSVGFDCRQSTTRKGRDGVVVLKQVVCSREGFKQSSSSTCSTTQSTVVKRRRVTNRVECKAKVVFKVNHNLDAGHQLFVASCVRANIGPTRSYRLFKEIVGEYSNVGATTFWFEYDVDEGDKLSRVFFADAVSRKNFSLFGDVVSFDGTYRTNKYNLVFVPFTSIDNHKRCITFGYGLLTKEDIDSYVWLLESFKKIMGHDPICVVTDQDPTMKVVVAQVFGASKHRFCMWHIMCKVGEKVGPVLSKDEVFRRKLNGIVWDNSLDPNVFELRWNHIKEEYGLGDNGWFHYLFESRTFWAPPYFHDELMAGLVRTTSRSESQNSFLGSFSNGHSSLVEFLVHYDSAIGAQRHAQAKLNADCEACFPVLNTPLALERHAMVVYTISIFYDVQDEICSVCFSCQVVSLTDFDGCVSYVIKDDRGLESVPSRYLVHRWRKGACLHPIFHIDGELVDQSAKVENLRRVINEQRQIFLQDGSENGNGVAVGSKQSVINSFCGDVSMGSTVDVHDPVQAKNKGSGKRLKSARERAARKCAKQSRRCHTCDEYGHNSRTCPLNT
ncbi:protein FAR1-RELATED SEQUENCE 5-like [Ipomoea triloba]|uniref:protein FAR1-RELATED SEQUENCE 5-like n=1 Tax=Ipomoea triloba TaxID=35885 RepID=UPI00125E3D96|nr:protein FAR1-RELATED SEQUENCE 5-like [Ipomoea triloba]